MTVVNVKSEQEKQAERRFPFIGKSKSNGIVVLFTGKGSDKADKDALTGVVIQNPDKHAPGNPFDSILGFYGAVREKIGHYSDSWNATAFEPYNEPVTLQDKPEATVKSEDNDD